MQTPPKGYQVTIIKKVPYLTEFLFFLLLPGVIVLLIAYLFLLPAAQSSNEMQVVALFLIIPENLQYILLYFVLTTVALFPLYKYVKLHQKANLRIKEDLLELRGPYLNLKFPISTLSKIYFKDPINYRGELKEKLIIYIVEKSMKTTTLKLLDYSESEELLNDIILFDQYKVLIADSSSAHYIESED